MATSRGCLTCSSGAFTRQRGRQALATALFPLTDVEGFERMEHEFTPDAIELGLGDALRPCSRSRGT
jgi:hypothetical protein